MVERLLTARIPVLCEKPLALTEADARHIAALSHTLGVPCFINHHLRANDCMTKARDLLASGTLGQIHALKIDNFQLMPEPPGWRLSADAGGGVVRDLTVHDLDLVAFLLGIEPRLRTASAVAQQGDVETPGLRRVRGSCPDGSQRNPRRIRSPDNR